MNTAIIVTVIICATLVLLTCISLLFVMWVINKGVEFENQKKMK